MEGRYEMKSLTQDKKNAIEHILEKISPSVPSNTTIPYWVSIAMKFVPKKFQKVAQFAKLN
jgi:hypothetical protein